jgi:hypothetical protein
MTDDLITETLNAMRAEPYRGCSDLYRWLRKHHDELAAVTGTYRTPLRVLLVRVRAVGIKGARGQEVSYDSLRQIWHRVCRDLARDAQSSGCASSATVPSRQMPSKTPADWRPPTSPDPTLVPPPSTTWPSMSPSAGQGSRPDSATTQDGKGDQVEADLARIQEKLRTRNY